MLDNLVDVLDTFYGGRHGFDKVGGGIVRISYCGLGCKLLEWEFVEAESAPKDSSYHISLISL